MSQKQGTRRRWIVIALVLAVIGGAVIYIDEQHSYAIDIEDFSFESGGNTLAGTIAIPQQPGPHGLVVFIHGDGAIDADNDSIGYLPIWEAFADAGYASVSWDKPGVDGSTGNWLDQTMDDRAAEANDAIRSVLSMTDRPSLNLDPERVGLIGFSQAGWVLPRIAETTPVQFMIAGSPAINWLEQGRFLTWQELERNDASPELRRQVEAANEQGITVLREAKGYDSYLAWNDSLPADVKPYFGKMTAERFAFVVANYQVDASESLRAMAQDSSTPVLLLLGELDANVDIADTEATYRDIFDPSCLDVTVFAGTDHSLLDHDGLTLTFVGTFAPRSIYADGMLDQVSQYAASARDC